MKKFKKLWKNNNKINYQWMKLMTTNKKKKHKIKTMQFPEISKFKTTKTMQKLMNGDSKKKNYLKNKKNLKNNLKKKEKPKNKIFTKDKKILF